MHRFAFPHALPPCKGIQPAFKHNFSGWPLGMGIPLTLTGMLLGLTKLADEKPGCLDVAKGMALWGIQSYPLATYMAWWTQQVSAKGLQTGPTLSRLVERLSSISPIEDNAEDADAMQTWHALVRQDDHSLTLHFLKHALPNPAKGIAWLGHCWQDLIFLNRPDLADAALKLVAWDDATIPLKARMEAELAFHTKAPEEALPLVEALDPDTWGMWRAYAGAELLLRMGKNGQAKGELAALWKLIPWHINLTLKLYDLLNKGPQADESDTADVAILAYSWNKADLLADTLDSLAQSDIGDARIFTLNNGSTDHTAQVLQDAQKRFGADRFHIETLPINVGAPAARNWLLALPEIKACKWAAFLDDDIMLPKEWLLHLLGAAKGKENIGAVGCRITAATPPYGLQSADYNLFPRPAQQPEPGKLPNRVALYDNCAGTTDMGLFTYTRPCVSVSGCCHLISLEAVAKAGPFDLRYTPSQFDDLDRDIRSTLAGMPSIYAGSLAIRHVQHSSLAKSQNTKQIGHVMGNKLKLDAKYTDEELATLIKTNQELLWKDFELKHNFLIDRLG